MMPNQTRPAVPDRRIASEHEDAGRRSTAHGISLRFVDPGSGEFKRKKIAKSGPHDQAPETSPRCAAAFSSPSPFNVLMMKLCFDGVHVAVM